MGRADLLIVLVAASGPLGCSSSEAFVCTVNGDCVQGGEPGICTSAGACAYADPTCDGGYRYPIGAPGDLAETCAPPGEGMDASTGEAETDDSGTTTSGTTDTTTGTSTTEASTDPGSTGGGSSSGTSAGVCSDDESTGLLDPVTLVPDSCSFQVTGVDHGEGDEDWFFVETPRECGFVTGIGVAGLDPLLQVCAFSECPNGPTCEGGEVVFEFPLAGCCSAVDVTQMLVDFGTTCDATMAVLKVAPLGGNCAPYEVDATVGGPS